MLPIFSEKKIDAILISHPNTIGYLSDFWGSFGRMILLKNGKKILISHSLYTGTAEKLCKKNGMKYREITKEKSFWDDMCREFSIENLGIEADEITIEKYSALKKSCTQCQLVEIINLRDTLRLIKTEDEIQLLKKAAQIGDIALGKTVKSFAEGITEKQLAWIFEKTAREELGAEGLSFDTIVAFGENSAIPHHSPTDKKLQQNMPILIDCGVKYKKYCSDLTRCFWFGEEKGEVFEEWKNVYQKVHTAQKKGIEKMKAGESISSVDTAARDFFSDDAEFFTHTFGHGVGIDIHESPIIHSRNTSQAFQKNMVVTAEPGLYFPGRFGIRIEDLLVIREDGAEFLSHSGYVY